MVLQQNVALTREIDASVYKKLATCFVKYYDETFRGNSLRTYPVQEMYLHHVVPHETGENATATVVHEGGSSNPAANADVVASDQLFSPSTKRMLEEIGAGSSHDQASSASSATVKRSLFEVKESEACTASSTKIVDAASFSIVGATVVASSVQDESDADLVTATATAWKKDQDS